MEFQSLSKKILQGAAESTEIHGEFFERILGRYKTPSKLCFLRFSLWDIPPKKSAKSAVVFQNIAPQIN